MWGNMELVSHHLFLFVIHIGSLLFHLHQLRKIWTISEHESYADFIVTLDVSGWQNCQTSHWSRFLVVHRSHEGVKWMRDRICRMCCACYHDWGNQNEMDTKCFIWNWFISTKDAPSFDYFIESLFSLVFCIGFFRVLWICSLFFLRMSAA